VEKKEDKVEKCEDWRRRLVQDWPNKNRRGWFLLQKDEITTHY